MARLTSTTCPWGAVVCRLLLLASLWDGPVLWGHSHAPGEVHLAAHLARFHSIDADPMNLGWHWHLSMPEREENEPTDRQPPLRSNPTVVVCAGGSQGLDLGVAAEPFQLCAGWLSTSDLDRSNVVGRDVFDSLTSTHSPQQLLCRMTC